MKTYTLDGPIELRCGCCNRLLLTLSCMPCHGEFQGSTATIRVWGWPVEEQFPLPCGHGGTELRLVPPDTAKVEG